MLVYHSHIISSKDNTGAVTKSFICPPLHYHKSLLTCTIYKIYSEFTYLIQNELYIRTVPKKVAPSPDRSRISSPILNLTNKIGSTINRRIWYKTSISIIFSGGHGLISTLNLPASHKMSGKYNLYVLPRLS